jgi:protein SCO1/2
MATLKGGLNALKPEELAQVQGMFVSVDPERDTPQKVQEYAQYFHPSILGLTDTPAVLANVAKQYNVFYRKVPMPNSAMGYTVDHSSWLYIIDKNGQLRDQVQHIFAPQDLANVIRKYL